ncbi:MAG: dihydroorotase [Phycisphaerales bacterium]|nr:dihydroorotase [Phycisphaerales bacterium]
MSTLLIANGRLIDPASDHDEIADVAIADGIVAAVGSGLDRGHADRIIDAEGCIVTPGLIDPHVHLREPGGEEAETIATGTRAAVAGGFTTVCCMPNTNPAIDDDAMIEFIDKQTERTGSCRVFAVGAATKGRKGIELAEIMLMARAGAVGFSDDGDCIESAGLMLRALTYIKQTGRAFMQHCQEPSLTRGASMHAGTVSIRLGLTGWPRIAEEVIIERDVRLNMAVGCAYHVQHLSSAGSVEIVRRARRDKQPISAEASPHHLLLTHEEVARHDGYWTAAKMNPPLREQSDIKAMLEGIADGTISVLATDHAPHTPERKALDFEAAPFGIVGLETALPLYIKALVEPGVIGWPRLVAMMTIEPARLCGLDRRGFGRLRVGDPGDVTVIDPDVDWKIRAADFAGLSKNTPFDGWAVKGRAFATVVGGEVKHGEMEPLGTAKSATRSRAVPTLRR